MVMRRTVFGLFQRDARVFLVTTLVAGAAMSLYWIDFNLYLSALGLSTAAIGVIATVASVAGAVIAFPASAASADTAGASSSPPGSGRASSPSWVCF